MLNTISNMVTIHSQKVFGVLMGAFIEEWSYEKMVSIWKITCTAIYSMYREVLKFHEKYK